MYHKKFLTKRDTKMGSTKTGEKFKHKRKNKETQKQLYSQVKSCVLRTRPIGIVDNVLYAAKCLIGTGVQPNLVRGSFLPASLKKEIRKDRILDLCSVLSDSIIILVQLKLYQRLDDLHNKTIFNIVETLSLNILIGNGFMAKHLTSIYATEKPLKPLC